MENYKENIYKFLRQESSRLGGKYDQPDKKIVDAVNDILNQVVVLNKQGYCFLPALKYIVGDSEIFEPYLKCPVENADPKTIISWEYLMEQVFEKTFGLIIKHKSINILYSIIFLDWITRMPRWKKI